MKIKSETFTKYLNATNFWNTLKIMCSQLYPIVLGNVAEDLNLPDYATNELSTRLSSAVQKQFFSILQEDGKLETSLLEQYDKMGISEEDLQELIPHYKALFDNPTHIKISGIASSPEFTASLMSILEDATFEELVEEEFNRIYDEMELDKFHSTSALESLLNKISGGEDFKNN